MSQIELDVRNLKVSFSTPQGNFLAVNGINFQLHRGETLALVGESGCGKTVSALSILRLLPEPPAKITSGEIIFRDKNLLSLNAKQMREIRGKEIAMIFQDPMTSLNPVLTVGKQLIEILLRHKSLNKKEALKISAQLLGKVELPSPEDKLKQFPHQLSGGMRQRVMIAMALACEPKVLIADEPTTALDVLIQAQILELLEDLIKETGMSMLLITHDLGVVTEIAERVMVMYAGEGVETGPTKDLLDNPHHPYTKGLISSRPHLGSTRKKGQRLSEISGSVPIPHLRPTGCAFHPRCDWSTEQCKTQKPLLQKPNHIRQFSCHLQTGSI
ncbi:MAG: oligopeptide/dipeptide ABC transporter ATP-binding protein [Nitrospinales bacterium]|jgi:oligopeptide/dipeptide ABC transporter ATP-binding protein